MRRSASILFLWSTAVLAVAGEAAPAAPAAPQHSVLRWLAENPFSATLLFLVLATLVGSIIARFVRDRCLKAFEGYPVTLELEGGRVYHGELDVEKSGLEFLYERTTPQESIQKTSFLIYQPEYKTIAALVRYVDRLDGEQLKARAKTAERAYHPGPVRRFGRGLRNFFASIKDAVLEAFKLAMGRMKGIEAAAPVVSSGGKYIDRVGAQTIGTAADVSYDPLLEKQIGLRVVVALPQGAGAQSECVGTLREYTKDFFLLMDVDYETAWDVVLPAAGAVAFVRGTAVQRTPNGIIVENCTPHAVQLDKVAIAAPEGVEPPAALVPCPTEIESGSKLTFAMPSKAGATTLSFSTRREADLVTPRSGAFVRHKSEWVEPRKLVGQFQEAVGTLPGADEVISILEKGARLMSQDTTHETLLFVKLHGCGNDYIYIDCRERTIDDPPALSRRVSDRHFGIGSDGLILILPSERADYRMRMFNADGSESEMCGNGIRCFAKYLFDRGLIEGDSARIETGAGVLTVQIFAEDGKARRVRVNMGAPRLERADIPMVGEPGQVVDEELGIEVPHEGNVGVRGTAVSMGNPHLIIYVDNVKEAPVETYGPIIENHRSFPRRINVEFIEIVARDEVKMRVWERGSGETLACGTGASATCVAGVLNGKTDRKIVVHLLGGDLELEWAEDGNVYLTGPAEEVFEGIIEV